MKLTDFFLAEIDREVERSRQALEQVPEGKYNWKPHEKSMIFGYLADMVATIPTWITMEIKQDELDVAPAEGQQTKQKQKETREELLQALDESAAAARAALEQTTDDHLMTVLAVIGPGKRGDGGSPSRDDSGHDQSLGTSPGTNDCLSALDGCEGPCVVRAIRGRQSVLASETPSRTVSE